MWVGAWGTGEGRWCSGWGEVWWRRKQKWEGLAELSWLDPEPCCILQANTNALDSAPAQGLSQNWGYFPYSRAGDGRPLIPRSFQKLPSLLRIPWKSFWCYGSPVLLAAHYQVAVQRSPLCMSKTSQGVNPGVSSSFLPCNTSTRRLLWSSSKSCWSSGLKIFFPGKWRLMKLLCLWGRDITSLDHQEPDMLYKHEYFCSQSDSTLNY